MAEWVADEYGTLFLTIGDARVWLAKRAAYCDRGHWYGGCDQGRFLMDLDEADAFPRYYMDLDRAKAEMHDWLVWRMQCEENRK